jgi:hypothetical protein
MDGLSFREKTGSKRVEVRAIKITTLARPPPLDLFRRDLHQSSKKSAFCAQENSGDATKVSNSGDESRLEHRVQPEGPQPG